MLEFKSNEHIQWFAVQVAAKHEKIVASILSYKELVNFLPTYKKKKKWSDRFKIVELPLFPGYVFCQFNHSMVRDVLSTPGITKIVGFGRKPHPIADEEISALQKMMRFGIPTRPEPYLKVGRKVQITRGALAGVIGILTRYSNQERLVISLDMITQSVSIEIGLSSVSAFIDGSKACQEAFTSVSQVGAGAGR